MSEFFRIDRNGTKIWWSNVCPRCGGGGYIENYWKVDDGVCWKCGGTGEYYHERKEYTPEYAAKLEARRKALREKKEAEEKAKKEAAIKQWVEDHPEAAAAMDVLRNFDKTSEYFGKCRQTLEVNALFIKHYTFYTEPEDRNDTGLRYINIFSVDGNQLVSYNYPDDLTLERGKVYKLSVKISKHRVYRDVKQTIVKNVTIIGE